MPIRLPTDRLADGSSSTGQRMHASAVRTIDAYASIKRHADALNEELDDITPVHGVPTTELSDEDSMVIVVCAAIETNKQ